MSNDQIYCQTLQHFLTVAPSLTEISPSINQLSTLADSIVKLAKDLTTDHYARS